MSRPFADRLNGRGGQRDLMAPSVLAASVLSALLAVLGAGEDLEEDDLPPGWHRQVHHSLGLPEDARLATDDGRLSVRVQGTCATEDLDAWRACTDARLAALREDLPSGRLGPWLDLESVRLECEGPGTSSGAVEALLSATERDACGLVVPTQEGTTVAAVLASPPVPATPSPAATPASPPPSPTAAKAAQEPLPPSPAPQPLDEAPVLRPRDAVGPVLVGTVLPVTAAVGVGLMPWDQWTFAGRRHALAAGSWLQGALRTAGAVVGVGLYSRVQGEALLENPTRGQAHGLIEAHPGISIQGLRARLGVAWGTAVYHLERLERHGLVVSHRQGNHRRYFVAGSREAVARESLSVLHAVTARRLAQAVMARPGASQSDLCDVVGVRGPVASKYLRRLEHQRLVRSETRNRFRCYYPTTPLRELAAMPGAVSLEPSANRPATAPQTTVHAQSAAAGNGAAKGDPAQDQGASL